ncbi:wax ester/triacylglycerol synthase domain-containing protein [Kitasatospora sp. NPDC056138]|uniref:wax ester/triacylglycerol synthase domain-containing protein n=1 Tax=Kitasatospora sp. NPDC056138 TaxID=3345724 RepID=UPI0035E1232F
MTPHAPLRTPLPGARTVSGTAMPPQDAWFHRQQSSGAACMTVAVLAWFDGPAPTPAALRDLVRERLQPYERLRLRAAPTTPPSWPCWIPEAEFDPEHHVGSELHATTPAASAGELIARPLDPDRPPWQLHLLPADPADRAGPVGASTGDGFALLLRAHHALLDGSSLIAVVRALLDGPTGQPPLCPEFRSRRRSLATRGRELAWSVADLLPRARPLPFHGPVGPGRAVAFGRIARDELDAARLALSPERASSNAVFLAATAGALRTLGLTGRVPQLPGVCAMVPVDVRTAAETSLLGNRYATVRVPLPALRQPQLRLAAVHGLTRREVLKQRAVAQAELVARQPLRYTPLGAALGRYVDSPRYFSVLCSSGATYASRLTLGPASFIALAGLPPLGPGHPLAVTMFHHDATAVVTTVAGHRHRHLAAPLTELIHEEIRILGR